MSYGTNAPQGFQPQNTQTSATFTGQMFMYRIPSGYNNSIFTGDPVVLTNGTLVPVTDGTAATTLATMPLGIFQGCEWNAVDPNVLGLSKSAYWQANTVTKNAAVGASGWVITDPNATWNIQVSTSADAEAATATVKPAQIGQYATWALKSGGNKFKPLQAVNPGTGNTATGQSGVYLDASSIKDNPVGLPLVILGFVPHPQNRLGKPFCNVIVGWNQKIVKPSA